MVKIRYLFNYIVLGYSLNASCFGSCGEDSRPQNQSGLETAVSGEKGAKIVVQSSESDASSQKGTKKVKSAVGSSGKRNPILGAEARTKTKSGYLYRNKEVGRSVAGAGNDFSYRPPVREGDPFFDFYKDALIAYMQSCAEHGSTGGFSFVYVLGLDGKVNRAILQEVANSKIPASCAESLRTILLAENIPTRDGIYRSHEFSLGGE